MTNLGDWYPHTKESELDEKKADKIPVEVKSFLNEVQKHKWLNGGRKENWDKIEELVKKWKEKAQSYFDEKIPEKITRVSSIEGIIKYGTALHRTIDSNYYLDVSYKATENQYYASINDKKLAVRAIQLIVLAKAKEISDKTEGIATLEYEILDKGGWLIGFTSKETLVYFPYPSEIIIKKLKGKRSHE